MLPRNAQGSEPSYADPENAARKLLELANAVEPVQEGRIRIEKIKGPFLFGDRATPAEYSAGLELAILQGWIELHDFRNLRGIHGRRRGPARLSKVQSVDQRMRRECVSVRQLRTGRRTRPGQLSLAAVIRSPRWHGQAA